jgi:NADH-ubiquinone oxidoreductase chain 5
MMIALGLAQWNIALLHTVLHAFFKALLFLSAGVIIHSLNDEQDIRKMGGLIQFMPFTYSVMLIGTIALLGLPWLSGFYSKDLILELAYGKYQFSGIFSFILGSVTAFFTAFYSVRLINLVYLTVPNANKPSYLHIHSENYTVLIPLSLLALFAIFLGYIGSDFVGLGSDFFGNSLFYHPSNIHIIEAEFSLPIYIKLLPTILSIIGASLAFYLYHFGNISTKFNSLNLNYFNNLNNIKGQAYNHYASYQGRGDNDENIKSLKPKFSLFFIQSYTFLNRKYNLDVIYNGFFISGGLKLGYLVSKFLDKGIIELLGPHGLTEGSYNASQIVSSLDTGIITTYALYMTLGLTSILFILFSPIFINPMLNTELSETILNNYSLKLLLISLFTTYILYNK